MNKDEKRASENKREIKTDDLTYDPELYPRLFPKDTAGIDWFTVNRYVQEMRAGAKFPPIVVGIIDDKSYPRHGEKLINDGVHRWKAYKKLGLETIEAFVKHYPSKLSFFRDSIAANVEHGRSIPFTAKARLLDLLRLNGLGDGEISKIILVPMDKIVELEKRIVKTKNGRRIYVKPIVQKAIEAGQLTPEESFRVKQERINTRTVKSLLKQLIDIVRGKVLIPSEEIKELSEELVLLLQQYFEEMT